MKKSNKIILICLTVLLCLTFSACSLSALWQGFSEEREDNGIVQLQQSTIPTQSGGLADTIEEIRPSIVDISVKQVYRHWLQNSFAYKSFWCAGVVLAIDQAQNEVEDGVYLLTSNQFVQEGENLTYNGTPYLYVGLKIQITFANGEVCEGERVYQIDDVDSAILFVAREEIDSLEGIEEVKFGEVYAPKEGDTVLSYCNPLMVEGGTVSKGCFSAERDITFEDKTYTLIQTDAVVVITNGGVLFDQNGNLLGIVFVKAIGTGIEGLSFAIPVNKIVQAYQELGFLSDVFA